MRILLIMLKWKEGFSKGDIAQINEIVSIDESLLKLIQDESGLTSSAVQPYPMACRQPFSHDAPRA
jgi:hypothetical protein